MTVEDELRERAQPVALHEAGHAVVARVLGFRPAGITINVGILGGAGGNSTYLHQKLVEMPEVVDYLERRVQMLCAGSIAEHMRDAKVDEPAVMVALSLDGTARDDWAKVSENVHTICSIRSVADKDLATELERVAQGLLNKAEEIVIAEHLVIKDVAEHVLKNMSGPGQFTLTEAQLGQVPAYKKRFP